MIHLSKIWQKEGLYLKNEPFSSLIPLQTATHNWTLDLGMEWQLRGS